jgi:hypothetical protein
MRRRRLGTSLVVVGVFLVLAGAAHAVAYFSGNSCCATRRYSSLFVYETSNAAYDADGQVMCVQEHVYPNGKGGGGDFFDGYKCAPGSVSHSLNGQSIDQALCWINGADVLISCAETY